MMSHEMDGAEPIQVDCCPTTTADIGLRKIMTESSINGGEEWRRVGETVFDETMARNGEEDLSEVQWRAGVSKARSSTIGNRPSSALSAHLATIPEPTAAAPHPVTPRSGSIGSYEPNSRTIDKNSFRLSNTDTGFGSAEEDSRPGRSDTKNTVDTSGVVMRSRNPPESTDRVTIVSAKPKRDDGCIEHATAAYRNKLGLVTAPKVALVQRHLLNEVWVGRPIPVFRFISHQEARGVQYWTNLQVLS